MFYYFKTISFTLEILRIVRSENVLKIVLRGLSIIGIGIVWGSHGVWGVLGVFAVPWRDRRSVCVCVCICAWGGEWGQGRNYPAMHITQMSCRGFQGSDGFESAQTLDPRPWIYDTAWSATMVECFSSSTGWIDPSEVLDVRSGSKYVKII